jgi:hypothetical protein
MLVGIRLAHPGHVGRCLDISHPTFISLRYSFRERHGKAVYAAWPCTTPRQASLLDGGPGQQRLIASDRHEDPFTHSRRWGLWPRKPRKMSRSCAFFVSSRMLFEPNPPPLDICRMFELYIDENLDEGVRCSSALVQRRLWRWGCSGLISVLRQCNRACWLSSRSLD